MNYTYTHSISQKILVLPNISRISLRAFWIFGFLLITFLLILYIFQVNALTSEGYQIQNYQKEIDKLTSENKILEINSIQMSSLDNIKNKIGNLGFERVNKIYYIQILEGQMATK